MYGQNPFSEQKQQEAKVKVTDPTWSQNGLFLATFCPLTNLGHEVYLDADIYIPRKKFHNLNSSYL